MKLSYVASVLFFINSVHGFSMQMSSGNVLIVQNKGGGHGELGFQLAKNLSTNPKVSSITILQDDTCNDSKEPFCSYGSDLDADKVKVVKAPLMEGMTLEDINAKLDESFEYVFDNCSKGPDTGSGKAICDAAKEWGTKIFTYVSSAGMYQPDDSTVFPMPETTPVKESAGQNQFDNYASEIGLPLVSFRPQYIYGPNANKYDYIDWFFDRLVRGLPLPIPGDGTQKVSLTNSEDVASLLASVLDAPEAAIGQRIFNCGTDELIPYDEVAYMCAEVAGINKDEVMIEHFDPKMYHKTPFPFRPTSFYVSPDTAKEKLGWTGPKNSLASDLKWYYEGYVSRGGPTKSMKGKLGPDREVCFLSKTTAGGLGSIYDEFDPLEIDASNVQDLTIGPGV